MLSSCLSAVHYCCDKHVSMQQLKSSVLYAAIHYGCGRWWWDDHFQNRNLITFFVAVFVKVVVVGEFLFPTPLALVMTPDSSSQLYCDWALLPCQPVQYILPFWMCHSSYSIQTQSGLLHCGLPDCSWMSWPLLSVELVRVSFLVVNNMDLFIDISCRWVGLHISYETL